MATENTSLLLNRLDSDDSGQFAYRQGLQRDETTSSLRLSKTLHNDPSLSTGSMDLHGSTKMLFNAMRELQQQQSDTTIYRRQRHQQRRSSAVLYLEKVHDNFFDDAKKLAAGTIPQSIVLAIAIGIVCGTACFLYYTVLFFLLEYIWDTLPTKIIFSEVENYNATWIWVPVVSFTMCICVGLAVVFLGEPGDLPYTISRVHQDAFIPMDHVTPMIVASMFSILAGGSLGPEAPLVAICGALGGFVSRKLFRQKHVNVVRKHTLMGMAGALAAFFGCPLGGSLFALEVNSRFGVEYFEHLVESIFCGEICLVVFRSLSGLAIKPIWDLTATNAGKPLQEAPPIWVVYGAMIGLCGAGLAYLFALFHWANMEMFAKLNLLDNSKAVYRAILGCIGVVLLGLFIPYTMFWGEEEFQIVATGQPSSALPNIWPRGGLTNMTIDTWWKCLLVGFGKLLAISFTVAGGFRGGYIFPLMCSGAAFGRALFLLLSSPTTSSVASDVIPLQLCILCMAGGINVAITRTSLASTLILAFLAGEPMAIPAILAASICSLFATAYVPFIKTQITRSDIDHSLFHDKHTIEESEIFPDDKLIIEGMID